MTDPATTSARGTYALFANTALAALTLLVVVSTVLLGMLLTAQTQGLGRAMAESQTLASANARSFTQARREILRLIIALERNETQPAEVEQLRAEINRYNSEAVAPEQLITLGSAALLAQSEALYTQWRQVVEPLVAELTAPGSTADPTRAIAGLEALEAGYNQLAAEAEANLRQHGIALSEAARSTYEATAILLAVLGVSVSGVLALGMMTTHSYRHLVRQHAASARALAEANAELRKLSALASLTRNLVMVTDAEGVIEWVNQAFIEKTGYTLDEVRGRRPGSLLQGAGSDPVAIAYMHDRLRAGSSFETEILNYTREGSEYWVAIEARPLFDDDHRLANFISIQTDITARKQTEAALRTALEQERELRELKSRLVTTASHEFRTPLTAILSLSSFLRMAEGSLSAEKRAERLGKIEAAARQIAALIDDVLLFEQTGAAWAKFAPEAVDVVQVLRDVLDELRAGAGARHTFRWDWPHDPVQIEANPRLLRQILSNVLGNAVKYSPPGSPVEVLVERDSGRVKVRVRDYGLGIPASEQKHVFEPFYRASNTGSVAGTGLGMAIARAAVELHGGQLLLESIEGDGATFTVLLPAEPVPEHPL